jgi:hypothetical protein
MRSFNCGFLIVEIIARFMMYVKEVEAMAFGTVNISVLLGTWVASSPFGTINDNLRQTVVERAITTLEELGETVNNPDLIIRTWMSMPFHASEST